MILFERILINKTVSDGWYSTSEQSLKSANTVFDDREHTVGNINVITQEGGVRYQCPNCSKTYKEKYCLKRHMFFECGGKKPFKCPYCDYHCKRKEYIKLHVNAKHETWKEPLFNCPYCDHKSRQKCNLKTHVLSKHLDIVRNDKTALSEYCQVTE